MLIWNLNPIMVMFLAAVFLREKFYLSDLFTTVGVFGGVFLMTQVECSGITPLLKETNECSVS